MASSRLSCLLTAIAVYFPIAAARASEVSPAQLVGNYINLSIENPEESKTLLLPDAAYMIFDYGGPLAELFPEYIKLLPGSDCSKPTIQIEEKKPQVKDVDAEVVRVEWKCTKPTESVLESNVLRFVVTQQKIALVVFEDPPGYSERLKRAQPGDNPQ